MSRHFSASCGIDGSRVPLDLGSRLNHDRHFNHADGELRRSGTTPGIVVTTSPTAPAYLPTNIVVPLEAVLTAESGGDRIDIAKLAVRFRAGRLLAASVRAVDLILAEDGHSATLYVQGKKPWSVTGPRRIRVLQRLVAAHHAGNPAVATKDLVAGSKSASPQQILGKEAPWRSYISKVNGASAWQINLDTAPAPADEEEREPAAAES